MTDFNTVATILGSLAAVAIAVTAGASWVLRKVKTFNNRFDEFMEDWNGAAARPGVPHRPGVMERLSSQDDALQCINDRLVNVELEINPNGGKSLKDIVHRVDGNLKHVRGVMDDLGVRVTRLERPEAAARRPIT